ncbi:MAG TPA: ABC-type transport auxiliary lipoprotein family protein, partial [Burkholderiales bacterium]|nr:ABC-type transport auxiliary lipoprotein family protein [Burkholderiales bacterium]
MRSTIVLAALLSALAAGCGTPPQERFFTLAADAASETRSTASGIGFTIVVGPVTVPEMVDRPQIVL